MRHIHWTDDFMKEHDYPDVAILEWVFLVLGVIIGIYVPFFIESHFFWFIGGCAFFLLWALYIIIFKRHKN